MSVPVKLATPAEAQAIDGTLTIKLLEDAYKNLVFGYDEPYLIWVKDMEIYKQLERFAWSPQ